MQLRRLEPRELADERRLQGFELSSGKAAVAQRLSVVPSTVVDHTRKLNQRPGVRSARELVERVRSAPN